MGNVGYQTETGMEVTNETASQPSNEQLFIELAKEIEKDSESLNQKREKLGLIMADLGVNTYAQDPQTGAVYKVIEPTGTFITFRKIDYKRTALEGEKGGTVLSKKEAQENGFILRD